MLSDPEINVLDLLQRLGMKHIERMGDNSYRFSCPFPGHKHGDANPSAGMKINGGPWGMWNCFVCGGGSIADFIAKYEGVNILEARRKLREWYSKEMQEERSVVERLKEWRKATVAVVNKKPEVIPDSMLDKFYVNWHSAKAALETNDPDDVPDYLKYMFNRGFSVETLEEWEIGIDWEQTSMITIPYRDDDYNLVGFKARSWSPDIKPRYKVLGDKGEQNNYGFSTFDVSKYLYGAHRLIPGVDGLVGIIEGELNSLIINQWGYEACGISGQIFTKEQARIAQKYSNSFFLMFDEDKAALAAARLLSPSYVTIIPARGKDANEMTKEEFVEHLNKAESATAMALRAKMQGNIQTD